MSESVFFCRTWQAGVLVFFCFLSSASVMAQHEIFLPARPTVFATLKSGEVLEGQLEKFLDGRYTIIASGRTWNFDENQIASLEFQKRISVGQPSTEHDGISTDELIKAFAHPDQVPKRSYGDIRLVNALSSRGPEVIKPLMKETASNSYLAKNVGEVFLLLGPDHYPAMLSELRSGTPGSEATVNPLLRRSGVRAMPILRDLLINDDRRIRVFALQTLYDIGIRSGAVMPSSLTPVLLQTMDDEFIEVRSKAPAILAMVGRPLDDIVPKLLATLSADSKNSDIAYNSVLALKKIGRKLKAKGPWRADIDAAMRNCLSHHNSSIRASAAQYFGSFSTAQPATIKALQLAADDTTDYVRECVRDTLYQLGIAPNNSLELEQVKKASNFELVELLSSEDNQATSLALQILRTRQPSPELLELMMDSAATDVKSRRWNKVPGVTSNWDSELAMTWLEKYASSDHARVRRVVASTYATMELHQFPNSLKRLAKDPDSLVRSEAIRTLGAISIQSNGDIFDAAVPVLLAHLHDTSIHRDYHRSACDAAVKVGIGHPDVLPAITRLAKSSQNADLRESMIEALGEIGAGLRDDSKPANAIARTLVDLLVDEPNEELKSEVIRAISYVNSQAEFIVSALETAKQDPRKRISAAAAAALKKIEERAKPAVRDSHDDPDGPFR